MNKVLVCFSIVSLSCFSLFSEPAQKTYAGRVLKQMTPEEEREWKIKRASNVAIRRFENAGRILFVNMQKDIGSDQLSKILGDISNRLGVELSIEARKDDFDISTANSKLQEYKASGIVFLLNRPALPMSLVAPEGNWGMVNVHHLVADNPTTEKLAKRSSQEVWRVFASAFGASDSTYGGCVLEPIRDVNGLDAIKAESVNPAFDRQLTKHFKAIGMRPSIRTTYKRACQEGWAEPPTNKYQQAIWDKVHAPPANPMKIEFDPKKGR